MLFCVQKNRRAGVGLNLPSPFTPVMPVLLFSDPSPLLQQVKAFLGLGIRFLFNQGCTPASYLPVTDFWEFFRSCSLTVLNVTFLKNCVLAALSVFHLTVFCFWCIYEYAGTVQNLLFLSLTMLCSFPFFPIFLAGIFRNINPVLHDSLVSLRTFSARKACRRSASMVSDQILSECSSLGGHASVCRSLSAGAPPEHSVYPCANSGPTVSY